MKKCLPQILGLCVVLIANQYLLVPTIAQQDAADSNSDLIWLSNADIKVGLKKSSGGAIAWFSPEASDRNMINSFDRGRLVQQSWYGHEDGSFWNKQPWRWDPVQGGSWKGHGATILRDRHGSDTSFVRTRPVHWASEKDLDDCEMEQTIDLHGPVVHVHYRFRYSGSDTHPPHHQELPAFFVDAAFSTLVFHDGDSPWTAAPVTRVKRHFPNEYKRITEHWAAYVDEADRGIGSFVPFADELTCYRYGAGNTPDSCSYVAPIRSIAVTAGFEHAYDVWITTGPVDQIRERFQKIAAQQPRGK